MLAASATILSAETKVSTLFFQTASLSRDLYLAETGGGKLFLRAVVQSAHDNGRRVAAFDEGEENAALASRGRE